MPDSELAQQMRADWNQRALEDAYYYVALGSRGQDDEDFFASADTVVRALEEELKRFPPGDRRARKALEIGCGPGRLMKPMSWNFGEIHGVDVSDEMIRLAKEKLATVPNAFPLAGGGTDLSSYQDELFDFVYSYGMFQHIPSRDLIFDYLREARRVLKTGALLYCHVNGLPPSPKACDTWDGARVSAEEIAEFACGHDFQLLSVGGVDTQYMWITMRKQPSGWLAALAADPPRAQARILRIGNRQSGEPLVPASGPYACVSLWIENLPADCDLNQINIELEGRQAAPMYIGPPARDGCCRIDALLPPDQRTGLVPLDLLWFGEPLCEQAWVRITPAGPSIPRLLAVHDGNDPLSGARIVSRTVKLSFEELSDPDQLAICVDGAAIQNPDIYCTDPIQMRFEIEFQLPHTIKWGPHTVDVRLGSRSFPTAAIEVV